MARTIFMTLILALMLPLTAAQASTAKDTPAEKRAKIMAMKEATMDRLLFEHPKSELELKNAYGYGVFSSWGTRLLVASFGKGKGVVLNSETGEQTFMKMTKAGIGLGIGVKDYRLVLVFRTKEDFDGFMSGDGYSAGEVDAAFSSEEKGAEFSKSGAPEKGVKAYTMTKSGIILGVGFAGAGFKVDKKLNAVDNSMSADDSMPTNAPDDATIPEVEETVIDE